MAIVPGFAVKIKEQEKEGGRTREKERAYEGRGEETKKGRKRRRAGDRWSDFTLGLFSDGRRYETPFRACSNSGIPILRFAEIVTFHPARGFREKVTRTEREAEKRCRIKPSESASSILCLS